MAGSGGGGYSPQILVGMCRGKVKNGGLRSELERESARDSGSSSGSSSVKSGSPELTVGRGCMAGTLNKGGGTVGGGGDRGALAPPPPQVPKGHFSSIFGP